MEITNFYGGGERGGDNIMGRSMIGKIDGNGVGTGNFLGWGEIGRFILPYHSLSHISGHVARLDTGVPAHDALRLMMDTHEGTKPMARWPVIIITY